MGRKLLPCSSRIDSNTNPFYKSLYHLRKSKIMLILSYPHIEKTANQPARLQRLPRIRVAQIVMDYIAYGWSVDEICRQHPYLNLSEAYAAMGYYFDHQEEIDQEIREEWEQSQQIVNQSRRSPFYNRMKARGLL
jgi:hypothetical protein